MKIIFNEDTELAEYEAINRGYRCNIIVEIYNSVYKINAYTLVRLQQDYDVDINEMGFYNIEPNLIIVAEASKQVIIKTIEYLEKQDFFIKLRATRVL